MLKKDFTEHLKNQLAHFLKIRKLKVKNLYNGLEIARKGKGIYSRVTLNLITSNRDLLLTGIGAEVRCDEVEKILTPILQKEYLLGPSTKFQEQFTLGGHIKYGRQDFLKDVTISSVVDATIVVDKISELLDTFFIPFWDEYDDLNSIHKFASTSAESKVRDEMGQFATLKKLTIMIVATDSNVQLYGAELIADMEKEIQANPDEPNFQSRLNVINHLLKISEL